MAVSIATLLEKPAGPSAFVNRATLCVVALTEIGLQERRLLFCWWNEDRWLGVWVYFVFLWSLGGASKIPSTLTQLEALLKEKAGKQVIHSKRKEREGLKGAA